MESNCAQKYSKHFVLKKMGKLWNCINFYSISPLLIRGIIWTVEWKWAKYIKKRYVASHCNLVVFLCCGMANVGGVAVTDDGSPGQPRQHRSVDEGPTGRRREGARPQRPAEVCRRRGKFRWTVSTLVTHLSSQLCYNTHPSNQHTNSVIVVHS